MENLPTSYVNYLNRYLSPDLRNSRITPKLRDLLPSVSKKLIYGKTAIFLGNIAEMMHSRLYPNFRINLTFRNVIIIVSYSLLREKEVDLETNLYPLLRRT